MKKKTVTKRSTKKVKDGGPGPLNLQPVIYQTSHQPGAWNGYVQLEIPPFDRHGRGRRARVPSPVPNVEIDWDQTHLTPPAEWPKRKSPYGGTRRVSTLSLPGRRTISFVYDEDALESDIVAEIAGNTDRVRIIPCVTSGHCALCGRRPRRKAAKKAAKKASRKAAKKG